MAKAIDSIAERMETQYFGETLNERNIRKWNERVLAEITESPKKEGGSSSASQSSRAKREAMLLRALGLSGTPENELESLTDYSPEPLELGYNSSETLEVLTLGHEDSGSGKGPIAWPWEQNKERWIVIEGPRPPRIFDPVTLKPISPRPNCKLPLPSTNQQSSTSGSNSSALTDQTPIEEHCTGNDCDLDGRASEQDESVYSDSESDDQASEDEDFTDSDDQYDDQASESEDSIRSDDDSDDEASDEDSNHSCGGYIETDPEASTLTLCVDSW
jgi:hypothetical protein